MLSLDFRNSTLNVMYFDKVALKYSNVRFYTNLWMSFLLWHLICILNSFYKTMNNSLIFNFCLSNVTSICKYFIQCLWLVVCGLIRLTHFCHNLFYWILNADQSSNEQWKNVIYDENVKTNSIVIRLKPHPHNMLNTYTHGDKNLHTPK